ncbi:seipin-like isoform X2 [Mytilus edulis]|uniref:seipin-like isoform X2 n=1 Tax=Mytilus edulis TaxID=6550 RepID=UPI0039F12152
MILMFIRNTIDWFQETTKKSFFKLKNVVTTIIIVIFVFIILLWLSVFMYGSFYYSYMPTESYILPVHLNFRTCDVGIGACSFPSANISLLKSGQENMFVTGQLYSIVLNLDLPESNVNKELGMFIVKLQLYNKNGESLSSATRSVSTMLHYRSELLRVLDTFVFSPLLLSGFVEQKQMLMIEFFSNYVDDAYNPAVGIIVEIQNLHVQLYTMVLKMYAKFTGLRYFLYHWPMMSALFGISCNLVMLLFIALLSWYQCLSTKKTNSSEYNSYDDDFESLEERRKRIRKMMDKEKEDKRLSTSKSLPEFGETETIGGETTEELLPDSDNTSDSFLRHRHIKHHSDQDHDS